MKNERDVQVFRMERRGDTGALPGRGGQAGGNKNTMRFDASFRGGDPKDSRSPGKGQSDTHKKKKTDQLGRSQAAARHGFEGRGDLQGDGNKDERYLELAAAGRAAGECGGKMNRVESLIEQNIKYVHWIIHNKFANSPLSYDDMYHEGLFGLYKAAKTFDKNKGIMFLTYAGYVIGNEILMELRRNKNDKTVPADPRKLNIWETSEVEEAVLARETLRFICNHPNKKTRRAVRLRAAGYTQREIGERMGISRTYVEKLLGEAICEVRKWI